MAIQRGTLFPELAEKPDARDLVGLTVLGVTSSLRDTVRNITLVDEKHEIHDITFRLVDSSRVAILLDEHEVLNIKTEV
jgi:hypothetical protein